MTIMTMNGPTELPEAAVLSALSEVVGHDKAQVLLKQFLDDIKDDGIVRSGDFTKERHEWPQLSGEEIDAEIERLQAEHPEKYTAKQVKWTE
jgi:hypothetical protein